MLESTVHESANAWNVQRLVEMRQATSTRTKHERGKREKRAAEKEMARLNAQ